MKFRISKKYYKNIVAGIVIFCMVAVDGCLFSVISKNTVITEEHVLEEAMADGKYDGNSSDSANTINSIIDVNDEIGKSLFNILEIVPTEAKAVVGYTVGGCEPFDKAKGLKSGDEYIVTPQQMKTAYMDAFINPTPGSSNAKNWDYLNTNIGTINSKMAENSGYWDAEKNQYIQEIGLNPFAFEAVDAKGYYKKVGEAYGVFAKGETDNGDQKMYSKFYNYDSSKKYEYIFVYDEDGDPKKGDINVTNHKRIKYINNEKFIRDVFEKDSLEAALEWKEDHSIEVVVRTPMSVSLDDIESADVIIVNSGINMDYYRNAVEMYNITHGATSQTDKDKGKDVVFDLNHDFTDIYDSNGNYLASGFEKVVRIYERVVVREDVAFIGSRNCINGYNFETNMHKLMGMLFFVNKIEEGTEKEFAGRDIFMNYIKRYVDEPGTTYMELRNKYEEHKNKNDTKFYPDYRAPSIRNDNYYNGKPFMHYEIENIHVGHPLVLDPGLAIVGGRYVNGILEPIYDAAVAEANQKETLKRYNPDHFIDSGLHEKKNQSDDGYYMEYVTYKGNTKKVYFYDNAYNSMCNATDFAYIDDKGNLIISDRYSSDNGPYWYKIDYDDGVNGEFTYRRITWSGAEYSAWPWSDGGVYMGKWVFAKSTNGNDANLHMYYDYIAWGPYRPVSVPNGDRSYKNESLEFESALFKGNSKLIKAAVQGREVKREEDDPEHTTKKKTQKDYTISMNILNGDGVNTRPTATNKNKVLYFNQYEREKIIDTEMSTGIAYIPLKVRIQSSCKLDSMKVYRDGSSTPFVTYNFNKCDVGNSSISCIGTGEKGGRSIELIPQNADPIPITPNDSMPIYTYETIIYDTMNDLYINKRNTKFSVELNAVVPDGSIKSISDEITFVKRDFFLLE